MNTKRTTQTIPMRINDNDNQNENERIEDSISFKLDMRKMKEKKNVRVYRGYGSVVISRSEFNSKVFKADLYDE